LFWHPFRRKLGRLFDRRRAAAEGQMVDIVSREISLAGASGGRPSRTDLDDDGAA
jgi:hypothetical protein